MQAKLDEKVHEQLLASKKTLALAESLTGGALAHRLTLHPGASAYFMGGIVCYSNQSKIELLSVPPALIASDGAVSEAVAKQMAEGALNIFHTDYALAATGIAGPAGATPGKPVGTVWCALAVRGEATQTWLLQKGRRSRREIIDRTTESLLLRLQVELNR